MRLTGNGSCKSLQGKDLRAWCRRGFPGPSWERDMHLKLRSVTLKEANALVGKLHRHHGKAVGCRFAVGVELGGRIVGAAICGRPVARASDTGWTAEVTRLVTDGTRNACSMLYSACARAAQAMGYVLIQTYILIEDEPGTSLLASGWHFDMMVKGRSWSCPSRPRRDKHPTVNKQRWIKHLQGREP